MKTLSERLMSKVEVTPGCWNWTGKHRTGRPRILIGRRADGSHIVEPAARAMYRIHHGEPGERHVHHACENPFCVNPAHLVAVTPADHVKLHHNPATHCLNGHAWDDHASITKAGKRKCRACDSDRKRRDRHAAKRPCANCGKPRTPSQKKRYADTGLCSSCYSASLRIQARGGWTARRLA